RGRDRESAELPDQVGIGADVEHDRGGADDFERLGLLGDEQDLVVAVDHARQTVEVVELRVGVVVAVGRVEDVADRLDVARVGLADADHAPRPPRRASLGEAAPASGRESTGESTGGTPGDSTGEASSRASSAARAGSAEASTCSWAAWAPSPTAPRPSRVAVY